MKFKRIISKMLVFAMMLTFVPASYAKAADTIKPQVIGGNISVDHIAGYSTDVAVEQSIELEFSEDMDGTTNGLLNSYGVSLYELTETGPMVVSITKTYDSGSKKLIITHSVPLKEGTAYKISLPQGYCKDTAGNPIETNAYMAYQLYFSTAGTTNDIIPPVIVEAYPAADSVKIPADVIATIKFNEAMDASTINNTNIAVQAKSGWNYVNITTPFTVNYDEATKIATISIGGSLSEFTDYQIYVKENCVKDASGNILEYRTFPFKTASSDVQCPKIVSTSISDGDVDVDTAQKFKVTFDEALKYDTFSNFVEIKKDGVVVDISKFSPGTEYSSGDKVLSIPGSYSSTKWDKSAVYTITIKPGLSDKFDNKTTETYSYTFTTVAADLIPPTITSMLPNMLASNEENPTVIDNLRPDINVEFSEKLPRYQVNGGYQSGAVLYEYKTDANGGFWTTLVNSSYSRAFTVTPDSIDPEPFTKMSVKPTIDLKENVKYKLEIKVSDLQGNLLATENQKYFFTPKLSTGGGETDTVPPTIISTYPEKKDYLNRPMDIPTDMKATVKFSEEIDEATINSDNVYIAFSGVWPSQNVASTLSYDKATSTVTITPISSLQQSTEYVVIIKNIEDLAGNKLAAEYDVDFKTIKTDFIGPKIVSTYPEENATNVAIDKPFTITFDKEYKYDGAIFNQNIIVKEGDIVIPENKTFQDKGITFSIGSSNKELRISRAVSGSYIWTKGKTYTITVKGGILDESGNTMNTEKTWSFTTMEDDTTPPVVKSITPALSTDINSPTTGVALRPSFTVIFNEPLSTTSFGEYSNVGLYYYLNNNTSDLAQKVKGSDGKNAWNIAYDESDKDNVKITFTVTADLKDGNIYKLSLPVQDKQWNYCDTANFYFKAGTVVQLAPEIVSVEPINYSTGIKTDVNPKIVFNTNMDETSFVGNVKLMKSTGSFTYTTVESSINYDDDSKTATIVPSAALEQNLEYKVTVDMFKVKTASGTVGTKPFLGTTFTTENGDSEAPIIVSTTPADGSIDVDLKSKVSIKFSENVKVSNDVSNHPLKNYVSIYNGLNKIDVTPYINGLDKTIINIDAPVDGWKDGEVYRVQVLKGVGILDMAGNQLQEDYVFTFTCIDKTLTSLSVIETNPANNAIDIPLNQQITAKFNIKDIVAADSTSNLKSLVELKEGNVVRAWDALDVVNVPILGDLLTIKLDRPLLANTEYTVTIKAGVKTYDGKSTLANDYSWKFNTGAGSVQVLDPKVESIKVNGTLDLVNGAVNIPKDINKIEILFNKLMNADTIKKGFSEYIYITANADKTQDYTMTSTEITTVDGKTKVTMTGFSNFPLILEPATKYYLVIPNTVKDTEGKAITSQEIGFTTEGTVIENNKIVKADIDNVIINSGITIVSPVEVNLNPKKITILTEKELQGLDYNDGAVKLWEENGTTYGKLVTGISTFISGKIVTLDLSNVAIKENTVYRVQVKDYLEATDGSLLDKEYIFYFKPINKIIDATKGTVFIEGNNIIKKDAESKLTVKTDIQKMSAMDFVLIYDATQLSAVKAEVIEALKDKGITISIEKDENNLETGKIIFSAKFDSDVTVTDLINVTFKSLKGEKSTIKFGEIKYVKDNIPQLAKGNELIVMGLTLDLNSDGKVSILDVIMVTRMIGIDSSSEEWGLYQGRDINGDGKINELDADMISEHLGEIVK